MEQLIVEEKKEIEYITQIQKLFFSTNEDSSDLLKIIFHVLTERTKCIDDVELQKRDSEMQANLFRKSIYTILKEDTRKKVQKLEKIQWECKRLLAILDEMEERFYWQSRKCNEVNDSLMHLNESNVELKELFSERNKILQWKLSWEQHIFWECRKWVSKVLVEIQKMKEACVGEFNI